jgi:osmotically-inducible protein OsmY
MEDYKRYNVKRKEFAHGAEMNPGRSEAYGETAFRGWSNSPNTGRDYESNAGYRDHYNRLASEHERDNERNNGGQHRGKGPKSYRRTDDRITEEINDRMSDHPHLDASDIEVVVKEGEVTLTGTVESREAKRLAEDIGEQISGVKNIENRLRVRK